MSVHVIVYELAELDIIVLSGVTSDRGLEDVSPVCMIYSMIVKANYYLNIIFDDGLLLHCVAVSMREHLDWI